ncbi:Y-family DNA polymerase [Parapedobacter koreensis]|uniref:DNA polymerase V n=1 Tax=Parapedobacter koreensis TaxID=332977 RepID=A0A1H7FEW9_9SPHI|nr:Y-family DNA polymerase [Parapedobacter koreensis]SEK24636.1 DNA polymerase V [Parapedobacter koreensis]
MYALIDCNNFYVSCERAFQPQLQDKAGVVLSNNDGCAIARSQEAKDMGIKMGHPYFQFRDTHRDVWVRSSNYALYQDMMYRVTSIIRKYFPDQEIYSIDECFCDLAGYALLDPTTLATRLRGELLQCTGIPVCIGIARTKTLAKIANRMAKKKSKDTGVYTLSTPEQEAEALAATEIGDVWGIGSRHATRLVDMGITDAYKFTALPADWVLKQMTIVGLRMWRELRGESCIPMEYHRKAKKGIGTSRSFGRPETNLKVMLEALATYVSIAAAKLRSQHCVCNRIYVYARTSDHIKEQDRFACGLEVKLLTPTANDGELIRIAQSILRTTFKQGYRYQKVGVMLSDIRPDTQVQQSLFDTKPDNRVRIAKAIQAMDKVNRREGRDTVRMAATGNEGQWTMKQEHRSKRFTTKLSEIIVVVAK